MNQFGLIIQETTAGSNQQFVSAHLDINSPEIKETITDERTLASQLANLSDVYSVQVTKNYKVYSLIVTNLTDFLGRSGYYAIRLYGPKGVNLTNFESILANIKEKYINYTKSNMLNNQNYDDLLSAINIGENDRKHFVSLKSTMNCFYYFDDNNSTLGSVFNTNGVHLVHKIYAFNKNKAVNETIALSSGLKPYSQVNATQKVIAIVNNQGILKDLKINEQPLDYNANLSEFSILCQNNDTVVYNTFDNKTYKPITTNAYTISKQIPRPQPQSSYNGSHKRKKQNDSALMYVIVGLMVLVIGGGIFYFLLKSGETETVETSGTNYNPNQISQPEEIKPKEIVFEKKPYNETSDFEYTTSFPKLRNYKFVYSGNKWSIFYLKKLDKKGNPKFGDFYQKTLDDIDLLDIEKDSVIAKLVDISKHNILEEEKIKVKAISTGESAGKHVEKPAAENRATGTKSPATKKAEKNPKATLDANKTINKKSEIDVQPTE